ncbi:DNA-binding response regulator, OmpR family, contains REC and winged-helix (wHTH) domain [Anaerosphaera aminiphila DSM 21120]|uniref:DNA-binding response regulator, OmpR family, contains REC and winged-helix (WHTH) domain n=1 Tax=Anaerosphaera aminiphila DSM 21120 TaxID=1120995 RepID=A0A1M5RB18_9FIRM|nr:response regulator transcription factor [Anaerosphaera aminiphila]SHH23003.1 DNA-binding response regulator, OmpR family, contains REC and winged-helix (wHTH) domain [Anaerosphaera aminiphila DSM 21120]
MKLLIVEDDIVLSQGLNIFFQNRYSVTLAKNLSEARVILRENSFPLMILDLNLPDGDGLAFCRECKEKYNMGIVILTARDLEEDEVRGLKFGADDYITKPFKLSILDVRLEAVGKRYKAEKVEKYIFDFERQKFTVEEREISLTQTEQRLLKLLIENKGRVVTKEIIMEKIWYDSETDNIISVTLNRLRKKVGDDLITNHYGVGYSWNG